MTDAPNWELALDALEAHLQHAEAVLADDAREMPIDTWVKPAGLGPLPSHLVDRAMELRSRQTAVMSTLIANIPAALAAGRRRSTPPYGDVSA